MGLNTNENLKHANGITEKSKFECPKCNNGLDINKPMAIVVCSKCKKIIDKSEIVIN